MTRLDKLAYSLVIAICLAALMYCGYDNMQDEEKSAEVLSNAMHIAKLDAADRKREAIEQAFLQQAELSADQVRFVSAARGNK